MKTIDDAFALAVEHQQSGRRDAAEQIYRLILDVQPEHPAALNNLGLMLEPSEAIVMFRRAVAAVPDYVDALVNLSSALTAYGAAEDGAIAFERALSLIPDEAESLFRLGHILHTQGRKQAAAIQYKRAIGLKPAFAPALCNLGILHTEAEQLGEAAEFYRRALAFDPSLSVANLNMVSILEAEGRMAEAKLYRSHIARPQEFTIEHAPDHRRTVLVLANTCVGNIPLDAILPRKTNTRITWDVEFATPDQAGTLPPYDVAFNAVGNADVFDESFACTSHFAANNRLLNAPHAVAQTRRDRLPSLLGGIPGIVVPPVLRVSRDELFDPDLGQKLEEVCITWPLLIRPIAGHGGDGLQLVKTAQSLTELELGLADAYYVTPYHDYRLEDGYYRKYRVIYVDRTPYPYHLAISDHWLVHYFSASMTSAAWKRQEEHRFLADPFSALGRDAMIAVTRIGERLDLDFSGVDFTLLPDGRLLVFEANATMLVHLRDDPSVFPYKHVHVPQIFSAFDAMLDRHARIARASA